MTNFKHRLHEREHCRWQVRVRDGGVGSAPPVKIENSVQFGDFWHIFQGCFFLVQKASFFHRQNHKSGSCMVWEINMGVCPRLEFDNIMFSNCLGYDFYIYGALEFLCYSIANL